LQEAHKLVVDEAILDVVELVDVLHNFLTRFLYKVLDKSVSANGNPKSNVAVIYKSLGGEQGTEVCEGEAISGEHALCSRVRGGCVCVFITAVPNTWGCAPVSAPRPTPTPTEPTPEHSRQPALRSGPALRSVACLKTQKNYLVKEFALSKFLGRSISIYLLYDPERYKTGGSHSSTMLRLFAATLLFLKTAMAFHTMVCTFSDAGVSAGQLARYYHLSMRRPPILHTHND
jgi:hypothetical protein